VEGVFTASTAFGGPLSGLGRIRVDLVNTKEAEALWDQLVREHHYLGYRKMFGPRVKHLVYAEDTVVGAISYNRAVLKVAARDGFIGWDADLKHTHLHKIVCQNRFLILPWVKVKNLASHALATSIARLKKDWQMLYEITPFLVETFVDMQRFRGTCYKAAGWQLLGETRGFAKVGNTYRYHGQPKQVYAKVLDPAFRDWLRPRSRPIPTKKGKKGWKPIMMLSAPEFDPAILASCDLTAENVPDLVQKLQEFMAMFVLGYRRKEHRVIAETYVTGLLSNLDRKSAEPIAIRFLGESRVRSFQEFLKEAKIDDEKMLRTYQQHALSLLGEPTGMLNIDGSDFVKKGVNSVGVTRQYCGEVGKTENCQAGIFMGYSGSLGYGLLDRRLYMPQAWFSLEQEKLRKECAVPKDLVFQTKNQLALEMIRDITKNHAVPHQWIGCDTAFGSDRCFLSSLPAGSYYFADIRTNTVVFTSMPKMQIPAPNPNGGAKFIYPRPSFPPVQVATIAADENIVWQKVILGEGAKGPIVAEVKCLRVVSCQEKKHHGFIAPADEVWLYIRRYANGRIKYSISNAPADTPLSELHRAATMRWPIEQCFAECKSNLGMGHLEARSYPAWSRHMMLVMMAHMFIMQTRLSVKKNGNCSDDTHGEETYCTTNRSQEA